MDANTIIGLIQQLRGLAAPAEPPAVPPEPLMPGFAPFSPLSAGQAEREMRPPRYGGTISEPPAVGSRTYDPMSDQWYWDQQLSAKEQGQPFNPADKNWYAKMQALADAVRGKR